MLESKKESVLKLVLEENEGNGDKGEDVVFTNESAVAEVNISTEVVFLDKFLRAAALAIRHVDDDDLAHYSNKRDPFLLLLKYHNMFRQQVLTNGFRADGRKCEELRLLSCKLGTYDGSAIYTEGVTKILATVKGPTAVFYLFLFAKESSSYIHRHE